MLSTIVGLLLVYLAYAYLRNLNDCSCVNQIYVDRMKYIESILLVIGGISVILSILTNIIMVDLVNMIKKNLGIAALVTALYALFMLIVYMYFVYDTYQFSSTMEIPCKCADGWQKYYIYFQAIMMVFIIFGSAGASLYALTNPRIITDIYDALKKIPSKVSSISDRRSRK